MCSSGESSIISAPRPLQVKMAQHTFLASKSLILSDARCRYDERATHEFSELRIRSPRLSPLIKQRASIFESPQHQSRSMVAMFIAAEETEEIIEFSDDDSEEEEEGPINCPTVIHRHHRQPLSSSIKNRISMFESPQKATPKRPELESPSKRNGFIQAKARLFEMLKTCGKSSLKFPGKLVSKMTGKLGKKRRQTNLDKLSKIDAEEKVREVDELFDLFQDRTGKAPERLEILREKVKTSHREHFQQKEKEQQRERAVMAYKEGLEKDKLDRERQSILPFSNETDDTESGDVSYIPSSILSAGLSREQLKRRRSVARSLHVAVDLPDEYRQSKKHAALIAACKQEYRCKSLALPLEASYVEADRMGATRSTSITHRVQVMDQNEWHERLSSIAENWSNNARRDRPSLPPHFADFGNEVMMSESEVEDLSEVPFPEITAPCRIPDSNTEEELAMRRTDNSVPELQLPNLRRLPSIRRIPSTSSSETKKSRDKKKSDKKISKKDEHKSKKDKKKKKKKKKDKDQETEKETGVKTESGSKRHKEKKENKEKTKKIKKTVSFAEAPIDDFEMTAMVRKLQGARDSAKSLLQTMTDSAPRKPQRRPSLASHTDVGLELCQHLRVRESHVFD